MKTRIILTSAVLVLSGVIIWFIQRRRRRTSREFKLNVNAKEFIPTIKKVEVEPFTFNIKAPEFKPSMPLPNKKIEIKKPIVCQDREKCTKKKTCSFYHPVHICKYKEDCKFQEECLYIH